MIKSLALALAASLRPAPKTYLIALLSCLSLASIDARAASSNLALREKDVKRSERIIAKLRSLEQSQPASAELKQQPKPFEKIPGSLFAQVADLRASDLKTDLTTALFLYDETLSMRFKADRTGLDCESELREVYAKLCRENRTATLADFLRAKARLHIEWAEATINDYRGVKDAATTATLAEMRRERLHDVKLAKQAVMALKSLEKEVYDYSSLAEFEEKGRLAHVSFEQFSEDVTQMLQQVDSVLLSLPRGKLFYPLYHARNSYKDGLFWWRKTYRQSKMVVNVSSFSEPDEMKSSNLDSDTVNYTVVINWRKAIKHTREAINIIEASKTG